MRTEWRVANLWHTRGQGLDPRCRLTGRLSCATDSHAVSSIRNMPKPSYLLLAIVVACGDDPSATGVPPIGANEVRLTPRVFDLRAGESQALQVHVADASGRPIPAPAVTWSSTRTGVATVDGVGRVTGVTVGSAQIIARTGAGSDTAEVRVIPPSPADASIDVYPDLQYQEMLGWEGTDQLGENECDPAAFNASRTELLNRLVNELGINRVRLETRSGHENPQDWYTPYRNSHDPGPWQAHRYESINDNDDPRVARPGGFQFAELDHKVEVIIAPMRALLEARGERLYVNLTYVDFGASAWEQSSNPEEYAELIHEAFLHLQNRYGWVPDAVEVSLEPDNRQNWTGEVMGRALVAAGDRLKASGFRPAFIAPSTTNTRAALDFLAGITSVPRVLEYLTDVAYHRYAEASSANVAAIAARANALGLRTAMLEHIESGHQDLHEDLKVGQNSAWQQFTLAYCGADNGAHYYWFDESAQSSSSARMGERTRYFRQYFSFVRLHARRIGAVSGDSRLDPLAFRNADGRIVVVVKASAEASIQVRRLPAGDYGVTFTTSSQSFVSLPDVTVGSSGTLQVAMPDAGVITIYQR